MSSSQESRNSTKRRGASFRSLLIVFNTVTSINLDYVIRVSTSSSDRSTAAFVANRDIDCLASRYVILGSTIEEISENWKIDVSPAEVSSLPIV